MSLKDKWLDYYEANATWIRYLMKNDNSWHQSLKDGGFRPNSHFILGVATILEPKLQEMIFTFAKLNTDENELVGAIGLCFDPQKELQKRAEERKNSVSEIDEIEKIRRQLQKGEI